MAYDAESSSAHYEDQIGVVQKLSNEESDPFLLYGKHANDSPLYSKYKNSISKFSSVRDCLIKSQRNSQEPNLLKVDWNRISNHREAEVCIFRIANSYGDKSMVKKWLLKSGLTINGEIPQGNHSYCIDSNWSINENGPLFGSNVFSRLWQKSMFYGISVSVCYATEQNSLYGVSVVLNSQ